jgi:hypothetical protein
VLCYVGYECCPSTDELLPREVMWRSSTLYHIKTHVLSTQSDGVEWSEGA